LAFFSRDYRRVAQLHVDSGWVPVHTSVSEFEIAIRSVCDPIFQKPLSEISFGAVLVQLFNTARRFEMEVQPQLVLLQKTLLNIEGLGRQLYPDLDLWATGKPFLEQWMLDRRGPKALFDRVLEQAPLIIDRLPDMPMLLHALVESQTMASQSASFSVPRGDGETTTPAVRANPINSRAYGLARQSAGLHKSERARQRALVSTVAGGSMLLACVIIGSARYVVSEGEISTLPWYLWPFALISIFMLLRGVMRS